MENTLEKDIENLERIQTYSERLSKEHGGGFHEAIVSHTNKLKTILEGIRDNKNGHNEYRPVKALNESLIQGALRNQLSHIDFYGKIDWSKNPPETSSPYIAHFAISEDDICDGHLPSPKNMKTAIWLSKYEFKMDKTMIELAKSTRSNTLDSMESTWNNLDNEVNTFIQNKVKPSIEKQKHELDTYLNELELTKN